MITTTTTTTTTTITTGARKDGENAIAHLENMYEKKLASESIYLNKMKQAYDEFLVNFKMDAGRCRCSVVWCKVRVCNLFAKTARQCLLQIFVVLLPVPMAFLYYRCIFSDTYLNLCFSLK